MDLTRVARAITPVTIERQKHYGTNQYKNDVGSKVYLMLTNAGRHRQRKESHSHRDPNSNIGLWFTPCPCLFFPFRKIYDCLSTISYFCIGWKIITHLYHHWTHQLGQVSQDLVMLRTFLSAKNVLQPYLEDTTNPKEISQPVIERKDNTSFLFTVIIPPVLL